MDGLVLIRVAAALSRELAGGVFRDLRGEANGRYRLILVREERPLSILISLRPGRPWLGRPREPSGAATPDGFSAGVVRILRGSPLRRVSRCGSDRVVRLDFGAGGALVAELAADAPNLLLLDAEGRLLRAARWPRRARGRLEAGSPWTPRPLPRNAVDPLSASADEVDTLLDGQQGRGRGREEALARAVFGLSRDAARVIVEEARAAGSTEGAVLARRVAELGRGDRDPVLETVEDPLTAVREDRLDAQRTHLLPWEPERPPPRGLVRLRGVDAAATAGWYHEALDLRDARVTRRRALRGILERELRRVEHAVEHARGDQERFRDPQVHRRRGEALLAGVGAARRVGQAWVVPDPYDAHGGEVAVPAPGGRGLQETADEEFGRARRAERGRTRAAERIAALSRRAEALRELLDGVDATPDGETERALRRLGLPVGLEPPSPRRRTGEPARTPPRLEGVRMFTSSDGLEVLVGRSGRDNDRLSFRLAGPEDFWLHAAGRAGAHVVVRNEMRRPRPPERTLREAAAAAAWFSEAQRETAADVQWTRRKYVRRARGAPPGAVRIKRFDTVRVRPAPPPGSEDAGSS